ncbi:adenosylmethionine decarboxylase [Streptococcus suis]|uniref:adenosylmethionine decarboxylase n=1 Tax=Streptococcus suis TaxID=1307 RepID=UPI00192D2678|nr:adenosylmethionine decarboxylase [Streptococcus suis]MBL6440127.1 adenosylmethionine decarboxylase [Streptococcus suis]
MDLKKTQEHQRYLENSYKKDFIENQGTEFILKMINQYGISGKWLDLGSGACSIFWKIGNKNSNNILAVDVDPELQNIIRELFRDKFSGGCFKYFMEKYDISTEMLYETNIEYNVYNVLENNLSKYRGFDMVSQFGLLGLCKKAEDFISKTEDILKTLRDGGVYLAANWIFSNSYSKKKGFSNDYITLDFLKNYAFKNMLRILEMKEIFIENDPDYDKVIIYSFKKEKIEIGNQQVFDCKNINIEKIDSVDKVRNLVHKINNVLNHKILKEEYQVFQPYGITGFAIISASHISIHTWPEYNFVAVDIFSCYSNKDCKNIEELLKQELDTREVTCSKLVRGV